MLHKVPFAEEAETKFLPTCKRQEISAFNYVICTS